MPHCAAATHHQICTVVLLQVLAAALAGGLGLWWTGGVGLLGPLVALFGGAFVGFWRLGARQEGWPQRPAILQIAWVSAVSLWALCGAGYVAFFFLAPAQFSFSAPMLAVFAPLVALLPGLSALGLTLCAGDAAATALGSYDEVRLSQPALPLHEDAQGDWREADGTPVDLYERFSPRTLSRAPRARRR